MAGEWGEILGEGGQLQVGAKAVEEEQPKEHGQATKDGEGQIAAAGKGGLLVLIVCNPETAGKGHHLKKDKEGEEVSGEEHPQRTA